MTRHILVIDDDPKGRTLLRRCLEGEGFSVSEANDSQEAKAHLRDYAIALITLDVGLGSKSRFDLARRFAASAMCPSSC
jgi:DNA-binding response OmpR family regulator